MNLRDECDVAVVLLAHVAAKHHDDPLGALPILEQIVTQLDWMVTQIGQAVAVVLEAEEVLHAGG